MDGSGRRQGVLSDSAQKESVILEDHKVWGSPESGALSCQ